MLSAQTAPRDLPGIVMFFFFQRTDRRVGGDFTPVDLQCAHLPNIRAVLIGPTNWIQQCAGLQQLCYKTGGSGWD